MHLSPALASNSRFVFRSRSGVLMKAQGNAASTMTPTARPAHRLKSLLQLLILLKLHLPRSESQMMKLKALSGGRAVSHSKLKRFINFRPWHQYSSIFRILRRPLLLLPLLILACFQHDASTIASFKNTYITTLSCSEIRNFLSFYVWSPFNILTLQNCWLLSFPLPL